MRCRRSARVMRREALVALAFATGCGGADPPPVAPALPPVAIATPAAIDPTPSASPAPSLAPSASTTPAPSPSHLPNAPPLAPPTAPRGPLTWDDLADVDRSTIACRADTECFVETESPPCRCCNLPSAFALHIRERRRGPTPPQPPCTPACANDELPCHAPPAQRAVDFFRARCVAARCTLERIRRPVR